VGRFPGWFFIFYIVRYVLIALPAIYLLNHSHFILSANWWGKWAAGITALALMVHIWPWQAFPWMQEVTINIAVILLSISWLKYFKTFYTALKEI
jgi:phosphatidylglycerophosphate synthase